MITQSAFAGVQPKGYCEKCGRPLSNPISMQIGMGPVCRGHSNPGGSMDKKTEDQNANGRIDWNAWGDRLDHEGFYGGAAFCRILVNGNAVVCTEDWNNHGISVTNAAEDIATKVCRQHNIPMEKLVWIEHYIHCDVPGRKFGKIEHRFDEVKFGMISGEPHIGNRDGLPHFRSPDWKPIDQDAAEVLFGRPLPHMDAPDGGDETL